MAKKRSQRNNHGSAAQAADAKNNNNNDSADEAPRPLLSATANSVTAQAALQSALERLDAIAQEAHAYTQQLKQQAELAHAESPTELLSSGVAGRGAAAAPAASKRPREVEEGELRKRTAGVAVAYASDSHTSPLQNARVDVFAVTSALQYQTLQNIIAAYGLQLLPSLEDIAKRVTLAVLTPSLATAEAWEMMAVLCTTYRAGMAHALTEVLESLLREPGVLLLDAPQFVPTWYAETFLHVLPEAACAANSATAQLGGLLAFAEDQKLRSAEPALANAGTTPASATSSSSASSSFARLQTERSARKLRALTEMIYAAGAYVPAATLQQFALRHVMEVLDGGVLPCYTSAVEAGQENVATFKATAAPPNLKSSKTEEANSGSTTDAQQALHWRVPPAWHAACLQLLEAFVLIIHPAVPAQLLVTAVKVMDVIASRLHRGVPVLSGSDSASSASSASTLHAAAAAATAATAEKKDATEEETSAPAAAVVVPLPVSHSVNAAVVRLGHVLHLLRHPVVLAPYQPPQLTMEKAKRRVWTLAETAAATSTTSTADETTMTSTTTPATADVALTTPQTAYPEAAPPAQETARVPQVPVIAAAPAAPAAAVETAKNTTASPVKSAVSAPAVTQQKQTETKATPSAVPTTTHAPAPAPPVRQKEEADDDIPDIVLDD